MADKIIELAAGTYDVHDVTAGTTTQVTVPVLTAGAIDQASPTIGDVLTVSGSNASDRATFQWQSASTVDGTYSNIAGATNSSFDTTGLMEAFFRRVTFEGLQGPVYTDGVGVDNITVTTPPQIIGENYPGGTVTIIEGTYESESPVLAPGVLTLNGVDVSADLDSLDYTIPAETPIGHVLEWTETPTNDTGTGNTQSASVSIVEDIRTQFTNIAEKESALGYSLPSLPAELLSFWFSATIYTGIVNPSGVIFGLFNTGINDRYLYFTLSGQTTSRFSSVSATSHNSVDFTSANVSGKHRITWWIHNDGEFTKPKVFIDNEPMQVTGFVERALTSSNPQYNHYDFASFGGNARSGVYGGNSVKEGIADLAFGTGDPSDYHAGWMAGTETENYDFEADPSATLTDKFLALRETSNYATPELLDASSGLPADWVVLGQSLSWVEEVDQTPPTRNEPYIVPAFSTADYEGTRRIEAGFMGITDPADLTLNSLTLDGADISADYDAATATFTCTTPGTLAGSVTWKGETYTVSGEIHAADPVLPASQQQFPFAADGDGIAANIPLWVSPGAGTTYATLADLQAAVDNLTAGQTLIVADADYSGQGSLVLSGGDYENAEIRTENLHGVTIDNIISANGTAATKDKVQNLTISGFKGSVRLARSSGCVVEYIDMTGTDMVYKGDGPAEASTGTLRYIYGESHGQITLGDFGELTMKGILLFNCTSPGDFTTFRGAARKCFFSDWVVKICKQPEGPQHADTFQMEVGDQQLSGYMRRFVMLDYNEQDIEATQGVLLRPSDANDCLFEDMILDVTNKRHFDLLSSTSNISVERIANLNFFDIRGDDFGLHIEKSTWANADLPGRRSDGGDNISGGLAAVFPSRAQTAGMNHTNYVSDAAYPNAGPQTWIQELITASATQ